MGFSSGRDSLGHDIEQSGYYPALVFGVLDVAIAGEDVSAHLVHVETTFVLGHVQRHVTVLVLTPTRFLIAHVDDRPADERNPQASATASTETVAIDNIKTVAMTYGVSNPASHRSGALPDDVTLAIAWGAVSRVDLGPADCGDQNCTAEHGTTGTITPDDVVVRVSTQAEGEAAVLRAIEFSRTLSAATAGIVPQHI
ncbi:DUF5998 family protein [Rarobacter faecitabidus]|uniref:Phosphodiesterase n=1 Tax=Rarobacter faecitabidus TaxID=13243 RepID=A0A542ZVC5_RARFA|nr:DUF5998 family protein [Rarobacter faecitabidus]TQL64292.1 hypothetical protein FB461_0790 [Rarobacter faecitabidus]